MEELALHIDMAWILICAFLVMLMQAGFTCLETGLVRAKNSINVAIKNLVDFCISGILFAIFGFGLMFGETFHGMIGTSHFLLFEHGSPYLVAFFIFQLCFCGTSTTIVSGAVAERMRFSGYCVTSFIIASLIYPIVGHWAWAGFGGGGGEGWLQAKGFIDFAGSTVVHSVGGWMALAALLVIGPRVGRYGIHGREIEGYSQPMAALGAFLLWFGWFGFNGGSTLALTDAIPAIIANTALAAGAGGIAGLLICQFGGRKLTAHRLITGIIAGLVAITASAHMASPIGAMIIGATGGSFGILGIWLLDYFQIDDAIAAVPAHLFAGIWGTLVLAFFPPAGGFPTGLSVFEQFTVQLQGVTVIGLYAFGVGYLSLRLLDRFLPLRVTVDEERIGLNIVEHGSSTALLNLIEQMNTQARGGDFSRHVEIEPETEAGQIGMFYNAVLDKFNIETTKRQLAMQRLSQLANYDSLTGLANRRMFFDLLNRALRRVERTGRSGALLFIDLDGFKPVNDRYGHAAGDRVLVEASRRMAANLRETDIAARLGGDEFGILIEDMASTETPRIVATKLLDAIGEPIRVEGHDERLGATIGIALFGPESGDTPESLVRKADTAMYWGKQNGRGVITFFSDLKEPDRHLP